MYKISMHNLCSLLVAATKGVMEFGTAVIKFSFVTHSNSSFGGQGFAIEVTSFTDPSGGNCSASGFLCDTRYIDILKADSRFFKTINCMMLEYFEVYIEY